MLYLYSYFVSLCCGGGRGRVLALVIIFGAFEQVTNQSSLLFLLLNSSICISDTSNTLSVYSYTIMHRVLCIDADVMFTIFPPL